MCLRNGTLAKTRDSLMMDPPIKLFGQTIAFTCSASSQDDGLDAGTTSTGAWEELPTSPQDVAANGEENAAKSELTLSEGPSSCFPDLSSSGSNCGEEEKLSSSLPEWHGSVAPSAGTEEDGEDPDVEDRLMSQEERGDENEGKGSKLTRRPDKAVACPRCHSLETKFCYYNNYNINQPRHFCKHCQRYWTAGGTLRNVPVGAGRRKNKHAGVTSPRQTQEVSIVRSDAPDIAAPLLIAKNAALPMPMQVPLVPAAPRMRVSSSIAGSTDNGVALPYTIPLPSLQGAYIITAPEAVTPIDTSVHGGNLPSLVTPNYSEGTPSTTDMDGSCGWHTKDESPGSAFSANCGTALLHEIKGEPGASPRFHSKESGDVHSGWSGVAGGVSHGPTVTTPYGFFNGAWPYGYNVGWSEGAAYLGWSAGAAFCAGTVPNPGNSLPPPNVAAWSGAAAAGSLWTGMPWPMPSLPWSPTGWAPPWPMTPWAMGASAAGTTMTLCASETSSVRSASPTAVPFSTVPPNTPSLPFSTVPPNTPSLGKHCRPFEGGRPVEGGGLWAPKSLRMADPEEAMRSSVWRILGVGTRPERTTPTTFKAFQPKTVGKKLSEEDQQAAQATLHPNPAAMSRSMYFHESN